VEEGIDGLKESEHHADISAVPKARFVEEGIVCLRIGPDSVVSSFKSKDVAENQSDTRYG
jgi:hypothetical protein